MSEQVSEQAPGACLGERTPEGENPHLRDGSGVGDGGSGEGNGEVRSTNDVGP